MYLGLDLGTSGLRGLLVDADGALRAEAEAPYAVAHPHPGWSEQDPADWIAACESVVAAIRGAAPGEFAALEGIGISGQMHGATLIDAAGTVLRPCILWNDTRAHAEAAALDANADYRAISGNIVFPGFTAPKLAWLATHEPEIFAQIDKVLLPKDFLGYCLTGRAVSDMSDSAGTAWLDVGARRWSEALLAGSGMRRDQMPELCEGNAAAGTLRPELAASWGVRPTVVLAGGGGDNAAAACGVGALAEGDGFVSLGTSGVLLAAKDSFQPRPESAVHSFCHAVAGRWYQMGVILAATDSLNWLARNLGRDAAALADTLPGSIDAPGRIRFLPYLSGERTPHNDSAIRGAFTGLDIADGPEDLTRAVLEGVCFALRDSLEALRSTGTDLRSVLAIGGGSRSRHWIELLATILDLPIDLPARGEFGAALGAARLAACAASGASPQDVMTKPAIAETVLPRRDLTDSYEAAYQRFHDTYPKLKAIQ